MDEAGELSEGSVQRIRAHGELATMVWFVRLVVARLVGWYVVPLSLGEWSQRNQVTNQSFRHDRIPERARTRGCR